MSVERRGTKALELWARRATLGYAGASVENMTTSWRNGLAFCALIDHFRPDLIDFESLKAENVLENNALAYRVAEQHLGIPALLDAEDMLESPVPDRLSILTYVSQFYQVFGAPSVIKSNKSPKDSPISPSTKTSSPLTPQKTPSSSPIIVAAKNKQPIVPSKKEADFKTDKTATGGFKIKREECQGCQKPVFIAERILVGSPIQLRHRTCFRCARCTAQLTLANYYVTEKGQFCCETCPDEEKPLSSECSTNKIGFETSSGSDSDSDSSDSSIDASLSSAADQSLISGMDQSITNATDEPKCSNILVATKPRTIFLDDIVQSPATTVLPKSEANTAVEDNVPPAKPARSFILSDSTTNHVDHEPTESVTNSTVTNRLKFFEGTSQTEENSTTNRTSPEPENTVRIIASDEEAAKADADVKEPENSTISTEEHINTAISNSIDAFASNETSNEMPYHLVDDTNPNASLSNSELKEEMSPETPDENSPEEKLLDEPNTTKDEVYPDDLNPFGDDEEKEGNKVTLTMNPFGYSDEEENNSVKETEKSSKKNLNPFWSDDESYLHEFPQTPSKSKSPPPRPPPPTLKRNEFPDGKIPSMYSSMVEESGSVPPSPAFSSRSTTPDVATLRLKKKRKPAPIPPALVTPSNHLDNNAKQCVNDNNENTSKEGIKHEMPDCDDVLSSKIEKEKRNLSSKMNENINEARSESNNKQVMNATKFEKGEWKRKKGPAPSRPVPQKRVIRALPMSLIQLELCDIEVKQTELERQGVIMETLIRSKTEKPADSEPLTGSAASESDKCSTMSSEASHPGVEVEDLILQLFELVNEKNELFRRQTELMYLKREKRLEEEHAELEYEIRCSILKPNRTEAEIRREEELIARMMKVVEQRDQIVNCLELERQREAVEDESIATHMIKYQEKYIEGIDSNEEGKRKKKKKKLRLLKKKKKKYDKEPADADKDVDETEVKVIKRKKKKWFKKVELGTS